MKRPFLAAGLAPAMLLHACDSPPAPAADSAVTGGRAATANGQAATTGGATRASPASAPGGTDSPAPSAASNPANSSAGAPDPAPPPLVPQAEKGEKGARNVLLSFARAIELREWDQAWRMLSPADRQRWPRADFTRMFSDLRQITVAVPTGEMEGAAGSLYYTAPVTITARDSQGRPVRYEGRAVLRRVNDVDGATAAQLRWHFDRLELDWTH